MKTKREIALERQLESCVSALRTIQLGTTFERGERGVPMSSSYVGAIIVRALDKVDAIQRRFEKEQEEQ